MCRVYHGSFPPLHLCSLSTSPQKGGDRARVNSAAMPDSVKTTSTITVTKAPPTGSGSGRTTRGRQERAAGRKSPVALQNSTQHPPHSSPDKEVRMKACFKKLLLSMILRQDDPKT